MSEAYHLLYEQRYQKAYAAGAEYWGHSPKDQELTDALAAWVALHHLKGKRVIEFFCGEGASGVILSQLGCLYHGVDIAPSAVQKAKDSLANYPAAQVTRLNVVTDQIDGPYDAALDVMGFHMLVTDPDRKAYLCNAFSCLKSGAPMLFFREQCSEGANDGFIDSFDEWLAVTKDDYAPPRQMCFQAEAGDVEIQLPYVPGRSKTKAGYTQELTETGFVVDSMVEMPQSRKCGDSVSICVHKP